MDAESARGARARGDGRHAVAHRARAPGRPRKSLTHVLDGLHLLEDGPELRGLVALLLRAREEGRCSERPPATSGHPRDPAPAASRAESESSCSCSAASARRPLRAQNDPCLSSWGVFEGHGGAKRAHVIRFIALLSQVAEGELSRDPARAGRRARPTPGPPDLQTSHLGDISARPDRHDHEGASRRAQPQAQGPEVELARRCHGCHSPPVHSSSGESQGGRRFPDEPLLGRANPNLSCQV